MTLAGHSYEAHLHNSKCSEDDIRWSQRFSFVLRRFHYILSVGRLFSQKKHLKVPELCRSDVGYLWLLFKSARTYWTTYLRWTRSFARKIWITYERAHMTYHQNSSNQPDGPMVSTYPDLWYLRHDDIFHDSDKGPKHVEIFRTKCRPKIGTDKVPTTEKSPDEMPTTEKSLDKMPTFGWHFVRLAFCPVGILSYHRCGSWGFNIF